jgi:hypothetical protein
LINIKKFLVSWKMYYWAYSDMSDQFRTLLAGGIMAMPNWKFDIHE